MPDLYGIGLGGLSMEEGLDYLPSMMPRGSSPQQYLDQYRAQQFPVLPKIQEQQPPPAPAAPEQQAPFVTWADYQLANSKIDPAQAYQDYITKVLPVSIAGMGYTREQIPGEVAAFVKAIPPPAPKVTKKTGLEAAGAEFKSGALGYAAGMAAIPVALGLGGMDLYQSLKARSDELRQQSAAPGSWDEMSFGENFLPYLRQLAFGSLPYMAEFAATAGVGTLASSGLRLAVRETAKKALEVAAKEGAESAAAVAAQKVAADAVLKLASRATTIGAAASYPSSVGQLLSAQEEQGHGFQPGVAGALGVPYAALNKIGLESLIGRQLAGAGARTALRNPLLRGAAEAGIVGTSEAGQEVSQQVLEEFARAAIDPNYKIDERALARLKESAIGGALLGGISGGAVGALHAPSRPVVPKPVAAPAEVPAEKPELTEKEVAAGATTPPAPSGAPPAPTVPPVEIQGEPTTPAEQRYLYESMGGLDTPAGVRAALGEGLRAGPKVQTAIDAVATATTPEAKIAALQEVRRLSISENTQRATDELIANITQETRALDLMATMQALNDLATEVANEEPVETAPAAGVEGATAVPAAPGPAVGEQPGAAAAAAVAAATGTEAPLIRRSAAAVWPGGLVANAGVQQGVGAAHPVGPADTGHPGRREAPAEKRAGLKRKRGRPAKAAGGVGTATPAEPIVPGVGPGGKGPGGLIGFVQKPGKKLKQGAKKTFADWIGAALKREAMEAKGQDILDGMEERGESPQAVARKFWADTYFKLPAAVQERFRKMLQAHTGMEPGSAITQDLRARNWADVADQIDLGDKAENLEGTERGFVALMKEANDRVAEAEGVKTEAQATALEAATRQQGSALTQEEADKLAQLPPEEQQAPNAQVRSVDDVIRNYDARILQLRNEIETQRTLMNERAVANLERQIKQLEEERGTQMQVAHDLKQKQFTSAINRLVKQGLISKKDEPFYRALAGGQTRSALNYIILHSDNKVYKALARFLLQMRVVPEARFAEAQSATTMGEYWVQTDKINLDPGFFLQQAEANNIDKAMNTFLHETVHGGTVNALSKAYKVYSSNKELIGNYIHSPEYKAAVNIFKTFDWLKENHPFTFDKSQHYGAMNPYELAAEVFVNPKLQEYLKTVTLPKELTQGSKIQNAWAWFLKNVKEVLGLKWFGAENALSQIMEDVAAATRARPGVEVAKGFGPYTPEFNVHPATAEELAGHRLANERYGGANATAQEATLKPEVIKADAEQQAKTEEQMSHTPSTAMVGVTPEEGERKFIAYKRAENKYDLYEVTDPANPRGDPESKQANLTAEQVRQRMQEEGLDVLSRQRPDGGPPQNNATQVTRWSDGRMKFAAYKQNDGTWNVYEGEDLHDKAMPRAKTNVKTLEEVEQRYGDKGYYRTQLQSEIAARENVPRDVIKLDLPNKWGLRFFDQQNPLKYMGYQVAKQLAEWGRTLPESMRIDYQNILRISHAQTQIDDAIQHEIKPLVTSGKALMKTQSWSEEQLGDYHAALVAAERLPLIAATYSPEIATRLGPKNQAETVAANALLAKLSPGQRTALEAYAKAWKQFSNKTTDILARSGLLSQGTATAIKGAYKYYAPLGEKTPRGGARATGQTGTGESIYAKMERQRFDAITRGIDNQMKQTLLKYVQQYELVDRQEPDKGLFKVGPILRFVRGEDGVKEITDPLVMNRDAIAVYVDGEPIRILVNNDDMRKALDPFPKDQRDTAIQKLIGASAMFNYMYGATKTLLSPVFASKNFARDLLTAGTQLDPRIGYGSFIKALFDPHVWEGAIREGFSATVPKLMDSTRPGARLAKEAAQEGAFVSRKHMVGLDALNNATATGLDPSYWSKVKEFIHLEGPLFGFLSGITKSLENATRMAIYQAGREAGLSTQAAAVAAKTGTVNFEPKGTYAGIINPLYVFANAKMQGMRTLLQNLGVTKAQDANRRTQVSAGLAVFAGLMAGALLWQNSDKDKDGKKRAGKIPDYKRDNFIVLDEHVPGIPIPQELGSFYVLANALADYIWGDKEDKGTAATARFATNMIQNFWPSGSAQYDPIGAKASLWDYGIRMGVPTPFSMAYDLGTNKTTFGSEIIRNRERLAARGIPYSEMGTKGSSGVATGIAKGLASTTGFDSAPQQWDYLFNQLVGPQINLVRGIVGAQPKYEGEQVNPFIKQYMPSVSSFADKESYDAARTRVEQAHTRWQKLPFNERGNLSDEQKQLLRLYPLMHTTEGTISNLFKGVGRMSEERRKQVEQRATELRTQAMKRYYEATP